jgi:Cu/Ag efflux pump CusA
MTPWKAVILMRTGEQAQDVLKRVEAKTRESERSHAAEGCEGRSLYNRRDLVALYDAHGAAQSRTGIVLVVIVLVFFSDDSLRTDRRGHSSAGAARCVHRARHTQHPGEPAFYQGN